MREDSVPVEEPELFVDRKLRKLMSVKQVSTLTLTVTFRRTITMSRLLIELL